MMPVGVHGPPGGRLPLSERLTRVALCRFCGRLCLSFSGLGLLLSHSELPLPTSTSSLWRSLRWLMSARLWAWRRAFRLRKLYDGVQHSGVDRVATMHLHASLSDLERGFLRGILADAQWTSSHAFNAGEALTSACPCGAVKQDTLRTPPCLGRPA